MKKFYNDFYFCFAISIVDVIEHCVRHLKRYRINMPLFSVRVQITANVRFGLRESP